jgi:hypothetical protein
MVFANENSPDPRLHVKVEPGKPRPATRQNAKGGPSKRPKHATPPSEMEVVEEDPEPRRKRQKTKVPTSDVSYNVVAARLRIRSVALNAMAKNISNMAKECLDFAMDLEESGDGVMEA